MKIGAGHTSLLLAAVLVSGCNRGEEASRSRSEATAPPGGRPAAVSQPGSYADIVDRVAPAVVTIRSARRVRAPQQFPFFFDPFLQEFFGLQRREQAPPRSRVQRGLGSGVIVRNDGYLLTNHHVIDGAEEITVELVTRRSYSAKLIGSDPPSDLAVLKVDTRDLPVLQLGNSDAVRVGDIALAVGNPLGVGQTVTAGIISAKGRSTGLSDGSFEDFLQTDAPINQGNSGGALVNTSAELIGINSQIVSPSGGNIGIGFAVPSNMAKNVMDQLIRSGKVRRGQLGVSIQPLTPELARGLGVTEPRGVVVSGVSRGSAAAKAGLEPGDVIREFNGSPVLDGNDLRNKVAAAGPGTEVTLKLWRDGRERDVKVRLGELEVRPQ